MFLKGLLFGIGWIVGTGVAITAAIGIVALAEWVKKWWDSESERAWPERAEETEVGKELVDRVDLAIKRREKVIVLFRYPSDAEDRLKSAGQRNEYVQ